MRRQVGGRMGARAPRRTQPSRFDTGPWGASIFPPGRCAWSRGSSRHLFSRTGQPCPGVAGSGQPRTTFNMKTIFLKRASCPAGKTGLPRWVDVRRSKGRNSSAEQAGEEVGTLRNAGSTFECFRLVSPRFPCEPRACCFSRNHRNPSRLAPRRSDIARTCRGVINLRN